MDEMQPIILSTKQGYDNWSQFYDREDNPLILLEEPIVDRDLGDIAGQHLLDLGCGTGRQSLRLAARGARVTALDQSHGMLEKAREKDSIGSVDFREHNLEEPLPLGNGTFDGVVSFLVVEHIANLQHFFSEAARVLKPEGWAYVTAMHPAMNLKGVQARYNDPQTGAKVYPKGFTHSIADFINAALGSGLTLGQIEEYRGTTSLAEKSERAEKYLDWPMLLTLKFNRAQLK